MSERDDISVREPWDWYMPPELLALDVETDISERAGFSDRDGMENELLLVLGMEGAGPSEMSLDEGCCCWSRYSGDPLMSDTS